MQTVLHIFFSSVQRFNIVKKRVYQMESFTKWVSFTNITPLARLHGWLAKQNVGLQMVWDQSFYNCTELRMSQNLKHPECNKEGWRSLIDSFIHPYLHILAWTHSEGATLKRNSCNGQLMYVYICLTTVYTTDGSHWWQIGLITFIKRLDPKIVLPHRC